jgi:DNA anti-recombination protein RmuC
VKDQATETWDHLEQIFQTRVQRALHQLGMPTAEEITALTRKVDELHTSVEKLARAEQKAKAPRKAPARGKRRAGGPRSIAVPPGGT